MSTIAFVTDQMAIEKILEHLGLGSPQAAKPPPPARRRARRRLGHPATVGPSLKHQPRATPNPTA